MSYIIAEGQFVQGPVTGEHKTISLEQWLIHRAAVATNKTYEYNRNKVDRIQFYTLKLKDLVHNKYGVTKLSTRYVPSES